MVDVPRLEKLDFLASVICPCMRDNGIFDVISHASGSQYLNYLLNDRGHVCRQYSYLHFGFSKFFSRCARKASASSRAVTWVMSARVSICDGNSHAR